MPYYDYFCDTNGRTLEVRHGISESVETWGELCERLGIEPGTTPADSPVERKLSGAIPLTGRAGDSSSSAEPPCGPSCGCAFN